MSTLTPRGLYQMVASDTCNPPADLNRLGASIDARLPGTWLAPIRTVGGVFTETTVITTVTIPSPDPGFDQVPYDLDIDGYVWARIATGSAWDIHYRIGDADLLVNPPIRVAVGADFSTDANRMTLPGGVVQNRTGATVVKFQANRTGAAGAFTMNLDPKLQVWRVRRSPSHP